MYAPRSSRLHRANCFYLTDNTNSLSQNERMGILILMSSSKKYIASVHFEHWYKTNFTRTVVIKINTIPYCGCRVNRAPQSFRARAILREAPGTEDLRLFRAKVEEKNKDIMHQSKEVIRTSALLPNRELVKGSCVYL